MADIAELGIKVDSDGIKDASKNLKDVDKSAAKAHKSATAFGKSIGNLATALAGGFIYKAFIDNTIEAEQTVAQLEATLKSTGRYTPELSQSMQNYASSLQGLTTFGDEAILASQSLLLTFTQIGGDVFPAAEEAILNVATALGMDLKSATLQVGKALNDPILGITALSRAGIQFSEGQKDTIKALVETGRAADAQKIILKELETQFGGSAAAAKDTLGGALKSLNNAFGDLFEGSGESLDGLTGKINELSKTLSDPAIKDAMLTIAGAVLDLTAAVAGALPKLTEFTRWVAEELAVAFGGIAGDDIGRLEEKLASLEAKADHIQRNGKLIPDWLTKDLEKYGLLVDQYYQQTQRAADAPPIVKPEVAVVLREASTAVAKLTDEQKKAQSAAEALAESIRNQVAALQLEADTIHMTSTEATLFKLALDGASASQLAAASAALGVVDAYESEQEAIRALGEAEKERAAQDKAIKEEALSDLEKLAIKQQEYYDALQRHGITQDEYNKVSAKNSEAMVKVAEDTDKTTTALDDFAKTAQQNIQSQLADTLKNGFTGSFDDIKASWANMLTDMAAQMAAQQLTQALFGAMGGMGGGSGAGGGMDWAGMAASFAGYFDSGGTIPSGKAGIVGENGPELVRGPANVTSRQDTAKMGGNQTIVINQPGVSNTREAERSAGATRRAVYGAVQGGSRYA